MKVSINQPAYLPWLGYFERIASSDLAIVLDNVKIEKGSYTNRNKMRSGNSWSWLTVPIKASGQPIISDVEIDNQRDWKHKHLRLIKQEYSKAPFYNSHIHWIEDLYNTKWSNLNQLLRYSNKYLLQQLCIYTDIVHAIDLSSSGTKSDLVLNLCKEVGATEYISGPFGIDYLDLESFAREGILVTFQHYKHPIYRQHQGGFESHMAALDLLLNCGPQSGDILRNNLKTEISCKKKLSS